MAQTRQKVVLLDRTSNAVELIFAACRQCYSSSYSADIMDKALSSGEKDKIKAFIKKVIASGHESPIEHVKFTFGIEGVSRALTHQLVRHRLASYSQQSQRYVKEMDFEFVIPPSIGEHPHIKERFLASIQQIQRSYNDMLELLSEQDVHGEKASQDARFLLPQACESKIVVTMNCRELKHFFALRCCTRAQWEIRALAEKMLDICKEELPEVFEGMGAKCEELGYCPEGEKFTCGRYPLKKEALQ